MTVNKPNILFILADDLGWGDVSYHGSPVKTPNIDRLAKTGVELDYHYVCPVCTPTRTALMTGRHPGRFGKHATEPSNQPVMADGYYTLASMLKENGYSTGLFGKWHLGSKLEFGPNSYGFDYSYGSLAGGIDPYTHLYKKGEFTRTWHRNGELVVEEGHATDLITDEAIRWIDGQSGPWFCYVPYTAVHVPVKAPEYWIDKYSDKKYDEDPEKDRSFKIYAAYTSHMDYNIGRLVEKLKCMNILDDTIIVFTSDNGAITTNPGKSLEKYPGRYDDMPRVGSNYPLRGHKTQLYEGGIRTPSSINWAGHLESSKMDYPIHISDWMPTFANLLGCKTEKDSKWDGTDVYSIISGESNEKQQRPIYWNFKFRDYAVRMGDWKLIQYNEKAELFNIKEDPFEEENVLDKYPEKAEELTACIEREKGFDNTACRPEFS